MKIDVASIKKDYPWAKWVSWDQNGECYAWETKPSIVWRHSIWDEGLGNHVHLDLYDCSSRKDWSDSLVSLHSTQEPSDGWVSTKDRLPTEEDADMFGEVFVLTGNYYARKKLAHIDKTVKWWRRTGINSLPQSKEEETFDKLWKEKKGDATHRSECFAWFCEGIKAKD